MSGGGRTPATFTIDLVRPEVPLAVVVLYRDGQALQVTAVGDVSDQVVAEAMVAGAFELAELRVPEEPVAPRDEVYDVEADGGV